MSKNQPKSFKSIAKEAKNRLKSGFWENCKDEWADERERARRAGVSESRAGHYFAGKVTCTIKGGKVVMQDGKVTAEAGSGAFLFTK